MSVRSGRTFNFDRIQHVTGDFDTRDPEAAAASDAADAAARAGAARV